MIFDTQLGKLEGDGLVVRRHAMTRRSMWIPRRRRDAACGFFAGVEFCSEPAFNVQSTILKIEHACV